MRGKKKELRPAKPDFVYGSAAFSKFANHLMKDGKKTIALKILYKALEDIAKKTKKEPAGIFEEALENVSPAVEVRPKRVGGATYQVPREVPKDRARTLATRWIIQAAKSAKGKPMWEKLSAEILEAHKKQGFAYKKKEDTHKMAEANKAFAHFGWSK